MVPARKDAILLVYTSVQTGIHVCSDWYTRLFRQLINCNQQMACFVHTHNVAVICICYAVQVLYSLQLPSIIDLLIDYCILNLK
jgi:hypothetical protein